jgi:hypothetical protein
LEIGSTDGLTGETRPADLGKIRMRTTEKEIRRDLMG